MERIDALDELDQLVVIICIYNGALDTFRKRYTRLSLHRLDLAIASGILTLLYTIIRLTGKELSLVWWFIIVIFAYLSPVAMGLYFTRNIAYYPDSAARFNYVYNDARKIPNEVKMMQKMLSKVPPTITNTKDKISWVITALRHGVKK
jgi:hypothetical protein